jgi:hypothetical protein
MSWHEHHLAHSTNRNTRRMADTNDEILDDQRRRRLEAQGLIDFNAPAAVVRAVERRLAIERGEPVRIYRDPAAVARFLAYAAATVVLGLVLALIPAVAPLGGLVFVGGVLAVTVGLGRRTVALSIEADHRALEAYEAKRRPQLES